MSPRRTTTHVAGIPIQTMARDDGRLSVDFSPPTTAPSCTPPGRQHAASFLGLRIRSPVVKWGVRAAAGGPEYSRPSDLPLADDSRRIRGGDGDGVQPPW